MPTVVTYDDDNPLVPMPTVETDPATCGDCSLVQVSNGATSAMAPMQAIELIVPTSPVINTTPSSTQQVSNTSSLASAGMANATGDSRFTLCNEPAYNASVISISVPMNRMERTEAHNVVPRDHALATVAIDTFPFDTTVRFNPISPSVSTIETQTGQHNLLPSSNRLHNQTYHTAPTASTDTVPTTPASRLRVSNAHANAIADTLSTRADTCPTKSMPTHATTKPVPGTISRLAAIATTNPVSGTLDQSVLVASAVSSVPMPTVITFDDDNPLVLVPTNANENWGVTTNDLFEPSMQHETGEFSLEFHDPPSYTTNGELMLHLYTTTLATSLLPTTAFLRMGRDWGTVAIDSSTIEPINPNRTQQEDGELNLLVEFYNLPVPSYFWTLRAWSPPIDPELPRLCLVQRKGSERSFILRGLESPVTRANRSTL